MAPGDVRDAHALDGAALERACGWRVVHHARTGSTNDDARAERARGAGARTVVVADQQSEGRGREGRRFASPPGGLYASLLLEARPEDLPAPVVAAVALAAAEACEALAGAPVAIKWPNDLWMGGRKLGGILLEGPGAPGGVVIAGIGINLAAVPGDLPSELRGTLTALDLEAGRPTARQELLARLLAGVDRRLADLGVPAARTALAAAYARRQALLGRAITWQEGGATHRGLLRAAGLEGLEVEEDGVGPRHLRAEHVLEVRPAGASGQSP